MYFTQIARICNDQEENLKEIYNDLTHYHFGIILLLFEQDKEILDNMSVVNRKALEIVTQNRIILSYQKQSK